MKHLSKYYIFTILLIIAQTTHAINETTEATETNEKKVEMVTESIRLHHKSATDMISLIKPFLSKEAITSEDGSLIVIKTSPANMKEIKKIISSFDTPVHQMEISLSYNPEVLKENQVSKTRISVNPDNTQTTIRINKPGETSDKTQYYRTKGRQVESDLYSLKVLEDKWATIRTGHAVPQATRRRNADGTVTESIEYRQVNSGFHVKPKLNGSKVTLNVSAFGETSSPQGGGQFDNYQTTSTIETQVGYWISLSAINGEPIYDKNNKTYRTDNRSNTHRRIFLKVDIIP